MTAYLSFDPKILDQMMATARGCFLVCDQGGRVLYASPRARGILGIGTTPGERRALGDLPLEARDRDDLAAAIDRIFQRSPGGSDTSEVIVGSQYRLRPLADSADRVFCAIVELAEAETETKIDQGSTEDLARYQKLIEASPQGTIVHRNDQVLFANRAAANVLGYRSAEELRRLESIDVYVHPDDRSSTRAYRASRGRGEWAPDDYDFRAIRKDGTIVWINCRPTIVDWDGAPAFLVTFFDVTERKRAMDAMVRADARFRELLERAAVGILIECGGRLVFANRAVAGMFGHDHPQDVIDVGVVGLREADAKRVVTELGDGGGAANAESAATYFEFEGRRQDGRSVWLGCWRQPAMWDDEPALLSIMVDISERKRLEVELRYAHRMDAVGRLAGGLAHEVNNILAIVLGHLDVTKQALDDGEGRTEGLEKAIQAVKHGTTLAQRILAMSKQEHPATRVIDINQTAASISGLLAGILGQAISIETRLAADVWSVKADRYDGEAALLNIALNSRDAMTNGGVITLRTKNVIVDSAQASRHDDVEAGDYVLISVADNGPGMPPETAARAFEPFFTTKPPGEGTGLGLSMVHGFATRSGGFAEIESAQGQGTRVNLYLPRA